MAAWAAPHSSSSATACSHPLLSQPRCFWTQLIWNAQFTEQHLITPQSILFPLRTKVSKALAFPLNKFLMLNFLTIISTNIFRKWKLNLTLQWMRYSGSKFPHCYIFQKKKRNITFEFVNDLCSTYDYLPWDYLLWIVWQTFIIRPAASLDHAAEI